jgi:hypothetical protein
MFAFLMAYMLFDQLVDDEHDEAEPSTVVPGGFTKSDGCGTLGS